MTEKVMSTLDLSETLAEEDHEPAPRQGVRLTDAVLASAREGVRLEFCVDDGSISTAPIVDLVEPTIDCENGYHIGFKIAHPQLDLESLVRARERLKAQSVLVDFAAMRVTYFHVPADVLAGFVRWA